MYTLSSAEAPAGYPYKNSTNNKNWKRAGDDGMRALLFFLPSAPQHKEAYMWREELRELYTKMYVHMDALCSHLADS